MRKVILTMALAIGLIGVAKATITYNFNDDASGYAGADVTGFAGTASAISLVDGNAPVDLTATTINVGNTASGTITDGTDTFVAMSPGASSDSDTVGDPDTADGSGYLGFTLTPDAGQSLDFSGLSYQAAVASYTTQDLTFQHTRFALWASVNGGAFSQLGGTLTIDVSGDSNAGTDVYQSLSGTQLVTYDIGVETGGIYLWDALDISLDSLGVLGADEDVEFRLAVNSNLTNGFRFGVAVEDITVVPEPATVGMLGLGALVSLFIRRFGA